MSDENQIEGTPGVGFLGRKHHRLRFTDLGETFIARLILAKCPDPTAVDPITIHFSLRDFFRRFTEDELVAKLEGETISEAPQISEILGDFLTAWAGHPVRAKEQVQPALDYYHEHISTRINWLQTGDLRNGVPPFIEAFTTRPNGKFSVFDIVVRPAVLCERLGAGIPAHLELRGDIHLKMTSLQRRPVDTGPRIDFRKQVELLTHKLDERQRFTGEATFSILSRQIPFRWALMHDPDTDVTLPNAGTSTSEEKVLLPMFMEVNGFLDIVDLDLESDPLEPHNVVVRYVLRRPAARNLFGASNAGLTAATRAQLSEIELALYHRLHSRAREGLVFGGKPRLEHSFGDVGAWLLRKATYCLEEPTFLGKPAREWLQQHEADKIIQMEDKFLLPALYERLRNDFGPRIVKKPERFGGEIDLLFDDLIPIELKVRRDRVKPLEITDVDESFPASGQAAVYAGVSRLGFVVVLDLPARDTEMVSLENCATVVERRFPTTAEYPTCIVVIVLRCYDRRPSASR